MAQNDFSYLPFGAGGIPANENSGTSLPAPRWYSGTAAPTSGLYYNVGDVVWNVTPTPSSGNTALVSGWVCTTAGAGGTAVFQALNAPANPTGSLTTTATSGTLSTGFRMILLNPATTGTYSLPDVSTVPAGGTLFIKAIGATPTITLTPLGTNNYEANSIAAITLAAQNQCTNLISAGGTTWYNQTKTVE